MPAIETRNLRKHYRRVQALKGVSLAVEEGEIYGLLGQNGAGKTTLIKILLGIAKYWQGEAYLLDARAGTAAIRKDVGYLPEDHRFPMYHSANTLLHFYGQMLGVSRPERQRRIPRILESVGLRERSNYKIRTYSKGMKQRVGIAQALFHDPKVIFLDEPTDGVDPVGRREIRAMMQRLKSEGKTIFLNSHLLGEVELICDRVGILHQGELIREGGVEALTVQRGFFGIRLAPNQEFPAKDLQQRGYLVKQLDSGMWEIQITGEQSIDEVVDLLRAENLSIRHLVEKRQTLEDLFLAVVAEESRPGRPERVTSSPRISADVAPGSTDIQARE